MEEETERKQPEVTYFGHVVTPATREEFEAALAKSEDKRVSMLVWDNEAQLNDEDVVPVAAHVPAWNYPWLSSEHNSFDNCFKHAAFIPQLFSLGDLHNAIAKAMIEHHDPISAHLQLFVDYNDTLLEALKKQP